MEKEVKKRKSFFGIKEKGSTISREIIAGLVVFCAMLYILPTNVNVLKTTGMNSEAVFVATALASGIATLLMGLIAKFPVTLSAGMGMNAFFATTVCGSLGYTWEEALTITFISGIIFFIITITPIRQKIIENISSNLRYAISVGLGAFIALIGFKSTGIITIIGEDSPMLTLGDFSDPSVILGLFGVLLVFILLNVKSRVKTFAIAISMLTVAVIGIILGLCGIEGMPKFDLTPSSPLAIKETFGKAFFHFDVLTKPETYAVVFSFIFVKIFDTTGTLLAVGEGTRIIDEKGEMVNGKKAMLADASGAVISGILGTSPVTSFVESNIGVEVGGRTGLVAVTTGTLFLLSIFAYPFFSIFTYPAVTGMALVAVGTLMFGNLKNIDWNDKIVVYSTFIIIVLMILTYSISDGLGIGLILYCLMMIAAGRKKEVNKVLYYIAIFYVISYVINGIIKTL